MISTQQPPQIMSQSGGGTSNSACRAASAGAVASLSNSRRRQGDDFTLSSPGQRKAKATDAANSIHSSSVSHAVVSNERNLNINRTAVDSSRRNMVRSRRVPPCSTIFMVFSAIIGGCMFKIDTVMYRKVLENPPPSSILDYQIHPKQGQRQQEQDQTQQGQGRELFIEPDIATLERRVQAEQEKGHHHHLQTRHHRRPHPSAKYDLTRIQSNRPRTTRRRSDNNTTTSETSRNGLMIRGSLRVNGLDFMTGPASSQNDPLLAIPKTTSRPSTSTSLTHTATTGTRPRIRREQQSDQIERTTASYRSEQERQELKRRVFYLNDDFYRFVSSPNNESFEMADQQGRKFEKLSAVGIDEDEINYVIIDDEEFRDDDNDDDRLPFQKPFLKQCEPVIQPTIPKPNPTCNTLHEIPVVTYHDRNPLNVELLSTRGSWRTAWKVDYFDESLKRRRRHHHNNTIENDDFKTTVNVTSINDTASQEPIGSVVMKLLHLSREFNVESYQAHEIDVIVMDQLTKSPYVVNAYGFCGQSVLTDYAPLSGRDYVKSYDVRNRERLRIGRDLARGLADIQSLQPIPWTYLNDRLLDIQHQQQNDLMSMNQTKDQYEQSSRERFESFLNDELTTKYPTVFAHNDINIANTVCVDGKVKWNDFNIGVFLRKPTNSLSMGPVTFPTSDTKETFVTVDDINSEVSTELCPSPVMFRGDLWRSPEEVRNTSYVHLHMSDMYGLANILYQTMSRHQPWTHKETTGALTITEISERKRQGKVPVVPEQYRNATQRDLQSLYVATLASYHPNPSERPGALRMATSLSTLYDRIQNKTRLTRGMILDFFVPNRPPPATTTMTTTTR